MAGWMEHIGKQHIRRPYEYFAKDHLGNVRVVFSPNGRSAMRVQEDHYYPFGMPMPYTHYASSSSTPNRLLYNFKELLNYLPGLRWYDYGARMYDAQVGRWHVQDPLAEKYYSLSPYIYCANNPIRLFDVDGRYFDDKNEKKAARIERRAERKADRLEHKADRIEKRGGNSGDLRARAGELRQSASDIRDMRNDANTEYRYSGLNSKDAKNNNIVGPTTTQTGVNAKGDNVVTMFTENNMGSKLHEGRHGGDMARGTLTARTYGVQDEVSAYRAQYSWSGKLEYIPFTDFTIPANQMQLLTGGPQSFKVTLNNINQITPDVVNSLVDNPGLMQIKIYPPTGIPLIQWNNN